MMNKERPELKGLIKPNTTEVEGFQNNVLRPIIKMQHQLLIAFLSDYIVKRKMDFAILKEDKKKQKIRVILEKDAKFKYILIGSILGNFSLDEFTFYTKNASEINKRIIQIIKQRYQDSLSDIKI